MFSKACEYGIKATIYIAMQSLQGRRVNLKEISGKIDSPAAFTAKILHELAKNDILISVKGPAGGFQIEKNRIAEIKLADIVYAIDGESIYESCGVGLEKCNADRPCPVHDRFVVVRDGLKRMLQGTSLSELATGLEGGLTYLKR